MLFIIITYVKVTGATSGSRLGKLSFSAGNFKSVLRETIALFLIQGIPAFRDFTIRDPLYFVIQFQALNSWIPLHFMILKKKSKKKNPKIFQKNFFFAFFLVKIPKWRGNHEFMPKTESRNGGHHEFWNHEMRGSPV